MEYYKILNRYRLIIEQQQSNTSEDSSFLDSVLGFINNPATVASMDTISRGELKDIPLIGNLLNWLAPGVSNSSLNNFLFGGFFSAIVSSEVTRLDPTGISRIPYLNKALNIYNTDKDNLGNNLILFLGFAALLYPKLQTPINGVIKTIVSSTPSFLQPIVGLFGVLIPVILYTSPLLIYGYTFLDDLYYRDSSGNERSFSEIFNEILQWIQNKGMEFKDYLIKWYEENKVLKTKHSPDENLFQHLQGLKKPRTPAKYGGPQLMGGRLGGARIAPERSTRFGQ